MEHRKIQKFIEIIGSIIIILTLIEISYIILLNFTEFNFSGDSMFLYEFVYSASILPLSGTILWILVNFSIVSFLIIGIFLVKIANNNNIESRPLAKYMVVIGMVILMAALVKMNFLVLFGKVNLTTISCSIAFQTALYDLYITPIIAAVFWVFFISFNCYFLISGLFITGFGIKWSILQEPAENLGSESS